MKEYKLTTKSGEIIKKINAESLEIAIDNFSKIKKLSPGKLLEIYEVKTTK